MDEVVAKPVLTDVIIAILKEMVDYQYQDQDWEPKKLKQKFWCKMKAWLYIILI